MSIKVKVQKAVLVATGFLLGTALMATTIAMDNYTTVSAALNQPTYEVIQKERKEGDPKPDVEYRKSKYSKIEDVVYNGYTTAIKEMEEGAVLIKNKNNALPLAKHSKISLFGEAARNPQLSGGGSGAINTSESINWYDALRGVRITDPEAPKTKVTPAADDQLFQINETLRTRYAASGVSQTASSSTTSVRIGDAQFSNLMAGTDVEASLEEYDTAVVFLKRGGGEGYDLPATSVGASDDRYCKDATSKSSNDCVNGDYLQLSANEKSIFEGLKAKKQAGIIKKVVVVFNSASALQLDFLKDDVYDIDAAIWCGAAGEFGTVGVANILCGDANPSAGASSTLWYSNLANPTNTNYTDQNYYFTYDNYADFGFREMTSSYQSTFTTYQVYQEGMYLGYKYTETRYEDFVTQREKTGAYDYSKVVAYPFGSGLSYSTFEYSNFSVAKSGDKTWKVSVDVKNTGNVKGKEPVQVYVSKPYGEYEKRNGIQVPSVEIVDFGKTKELEPNETERLEIEVNEKFLTEYDANGEKTYILSGGDYYFTAARNAHDAINNILAAKGYTPANTANRMDAEGNKNLVSKQTLEFNATKYKYSEATGNPITNQFDFADINKYEGKGENSVKWMDRSDWEGTCHLSYLDENNRLVKPHEVLTMTQEMADNMRDQMDADKVIQKGGEYPLYGVDNGLKLVDLMDVEFENVLWDQLLDQMTWQETITLLSNGRHKTVQVDSIGKPGGGDENGPNGLSHTYGRASGGSAYAGPTNPYIERFSEDASEVNTAIQKGYTSTGFASNGVLAASFNKELAKEVGEQIGEEGIWGGKSGLLGTGLNILRSPYAGRTSEYYSEDATLSGLIAAPETKGLQSKGINCYIKHCALNESETARHGACEWINEQALRENYLRAFEIAIQDGGAMNVMTAFNRIGTDAVANCVPFAQGWLRREVGLPGIIETDAAGDMTDGNHGEAYVSRFCDVYMQASDLNEYNYGDNIADYTGGTHFWPEYAPKQYGGPGEYGEFAQRMRASVKRIIFAFSRCAGMNGIDRNTEIRTVTPMWVSLITAADITLGVATTAALAWVCVDIVLKFVKGKKAA